MSTHGRSSRGSSRAARTCDESMKMEGSVNTERRLPGQSRKIGILGSISGATSILGSWQVCHSVCLGIITLLSIVGITVSGMPLLFLTKVALPVWLIAVALLAVTVYLYVRLKCISRNLLLFNTGLLVIGMPFEAVQAYAAFLWTIGGAISASALLLFVRERWEKWRRWGLFMEKTDYFIYVALMVAVAGLIVTLVAVFGGGPKYSNTVGSALQDGVAVNGASKVVQEEGLPALSTTTARSSEFLPSQTTGSTGDGDVEIKLTPIAYANGKLDIDIAVNTHSVDLSGFDLGKITLLESEGKKIMPAAMPKLQGHHNYGKMSFNVEQLGAFTITITGIPKEQQRKYSWKG